jgi:hypothetical protein
MQSSFRLSLYVLAGLPSAVLAQTAPMPANNVLSIYRESVKVGKGPAHDAHETAWAGALVAAKSPNRFIAATALTGPSEIWYIAAYPGWADLEKANATAISNPALAAIQKQYVPAESEYLNDARQMTLRPRAELSYGGPGDLPNTRYLSVTRISVRPGHTAEFEEARKMIKAAHEAAKLTDHFSVWESTSGALGSTFYTFVARKTLAELDSAAALHGAAYTAALGGEEGQKKLAALIGGAVVNQETDHFEFTPSQSVPPDEWVTANPGFWKRKAPAKKTP